jgi:hypothetical protein
MVLLPSIFTGKLRLENSAWKTSPGKSQLENFTWEISAEKFRLENVVVLIEEVLEVFIDLDPDLVFDLDVEVDRNRLFGSLDLNLGCAGREACDPQSGQEC